MKKIIWAYASFFLHAAASASLQQTAPNNITFATAARAVHANEPALYVGASSAVRFLGADKKVLTNKLARISKKSNASSADVGNVLQPFAPSKPKIDGADGDHPLNNATVAIAQLATLDDRLPIFATAKYDDSGKLPTFDGLFLVTDETDGATLVKAEAVNDHEGNPIKAPPAALTAGKRFVFAAVSKGDAQFDDPVETSRGIAVFEYAAQDASGEGADAAASTDKKLKQINAPNYADATAKALTIDLSAKVSPVVAFGDGTANSIDHAIIGRAASVAWDEGLQRLYVGLNAVRCDSPTKPGGVLGLCMAYPTYAADGKLQKFDVNPVVDSPGSGHFYSPPAAGISENNNPSYGLGDFGHVLPGIANAPGNVGFSVTIQDLNICWKILKAAVEYVRTHRAAGNDANGLLAHLRGQGVNDAKIFGGLPEARVFLSDFNGALVDGGRANPSVGAGGGGGDHLYIFWVDRTIANGGAGNANTDIDFLTEIRARFVQLLHNAKIVNQAYAMKNDPFSVYTNSLDFIIGYYADGKNLRLDEVTGVVQARNDGDDDLAVSIPRLAVMNTSTGRPYLIAHSIMSTSPVAVGGSLYTEADNWIYALPLIPKELNGAAYLKGTIAAVTNDKIGKIDLIPAGPPGPANEYQVPGDFTKMPRRFQRAVRVGGGNPVPASWVQDMFVAGDSVYITLAGVQPGQQGVFKSTAIFDGDGCIIDWTPATRVMGSVMQTFASMIDPKTANFYSLTQTPSGRAGNSGPTTGHVTKWGAGTAAMHGGNADFALDAVLGKLFSSKKGGVHGVLSFDELTYGFPKKQLSMLMAYGFDGVALVQTGRRKGRAFTPYTKHAVADIPAPANLSRNVFFFNNHVVSGIGPITCGAVVHNGVGVNGYSKFYVGGYRGLAVLNVLYPNNGAFVANLVAAMPPLGAFAAAADPVTPGVLNEPIIAVGEAVTRNGDGVADHWYLHVLTSRGVMVNEMQGAALGNGWVAGGPVGPGGGANAIDGCVLGNGTIVALPNGLNFVPAIGGSVPLAFPQKVTPLQMQVISARNRDGLFELPATVYILGMGPRMADDVVQEAGATQAVATTDLVPQLWRVAVWTDGAVPPAVTANTSKIIDTYKNHPTLKGQFRPYAQYPDLRLNFSVDGSVWFDASSRDGSNSDFLRVAEMSKPQDSLDGFVGLQASLVDQMEIDKDGNFRIGVPVRDTSTGAWLVPGDWGLRVNE